MVFSRLVLGQVRGMPPPAGQESPPKKINDVVNQDLREPQKLDSKATDGQPPPRPVETKPAGPLLPASNHFLGSSTQKIDHLPVLRQLLAAAKDEAQGCDARREIALAARAHYNLARLAENDAQSPDAKKDLARLRRQSAECLKILEDIEGLGADDEQSCEQGRKWTLSAPMRPAQPSGPALPMLRNFAGLRTQTMDHLAALRQLLAAANEANDCDAQREVALAARAHYNLARLAENDAQNEIVKMGESHPRIDGVKSELTRLQGQSAACLKILEEIERRFAGDEKSCEPSEKWTLRAPMKPDPQASQNPPVLLERAPSRQ